jgi:histidinol-phosphatase (PHP family)
MDAKNTIFEMCRAAVEKGLNEIAITDHFEPTSGDAISNYFNSKDYLKDIENAREIFKGKLKIKVGVEMGQPHLFPLKSQKCINSIPYDYILSSVHKFPGDIDVSEIDYSNTSIQDVCEDYLNQVKQLAVTGNFDCIGHIDLIKRYSTSIYKTRVSLMSQEELLREVFKILISRDKGIEINTSGLRQSPKESMPGLDVVKLYRELGGQILTIGSDSHNVNDVGKGLLEAIEVAREAGFRYITTFENRIPRWISIDDKESFYINNKKIV